MNKQYFKPLVACIGIATTMFGGNASATRVQWKVANGGNDHWYEAINKEKGINFNNAKLAAIARGGYLATPNMPGEIDFIYDKLVFPAAKCKLNGYWLGAYTSGNTQTWEWVTGGTVDLWGSDTYIDWAEGDVPYGLALFPNNTWTSGSALQDYKQSAKVLHGGTGGTMGYVVEYDTYTPPIRGSATWAIPSYTVQCRNNTTDQRVTIQGNEAGYNCEKAGLIVNSGDNVTIIITGNRL